MSSDENKAVVRRLLTTFMECWPSGNFAPVDALLAADVRYADPDASFQGIDGYKNLLAMYRAAFPDATNSLDLDGIIAEGDTVVARWTARGTHRGDFLGIAATGKEANFALLSQYRFQNGKIVEICDRFDVLRVLQQLGVSPVTVGT
jgi:steroid delta-isomerase-like uncharacterized protein